MHSENREDLPIVERTAARLVVLDAAGRVLLLHVQDLTDRELVALVRMSESSPSVDDSLRVGTEKEDVLGARWWSMDQIMTSSVRFYPFALRTLLPRFLAGEDIEEQLERWPLEG
jgi:hypothetical protein